MKLKLVNFMLFCRVFELDWMYNGDSLILYKVMAMMIFENLNS